MHYDISNGDADGIGARTQLRLDNPIKSRLVTSIKRDINLLERVNAKESNSLTVLDIFLDKNRSALLNLLKKHTLVKYVDHHFFEKIPEHVLLDVTINTVSNVRTSLLINNELNDKYIE